MTSGFPPATAEFLQGYAHDAPLRWSPEDLTAQQRFTVDYLAGLEWDDWSSEPMALELVQASVLDMPLSVVPESTAIWLAGPIVELAAPDSLFRIATSCLKPGGTLAGIIPCLRDNSPESRIFAEGIARQFRPYPMVEELIEILREAGLEAGPGSAFHRIPSFNRAVLGDKLAFKGFRRVFDELESQGYDPVEVGWGEWRFTSASRRIAEPGTATSRGV
jgi:hypothetical protein